jgi:hypothetical protein
MTSRRRGPAVECLAQAMFSLVCSAGGAVQPRRCCVAARAVERRLVRVRVTGRGGTVWLAFLCRLVPVKAVEQPVKYWGE